MVSFFGFKIGGDKKKKSANDLNTAPPHPTKKDDRDAGKGQFLSREGGKPTPHGGNVYSVSRPDTSHSYMITARPVKASPYGSHTSPIGAMSMSDLRPPNYSNLKQYASNPNMGNSWHNASTPDLVPPVPIRNPSRPSTPVKQQPPNWISPLEMNSTNILPPSVAVAARSPMVQHGLKLKIPSEQAAVYVDDDASPKAPMPLRIRRPSPSPKPESPLRGNQSPRKPPSPPQSVRASEDSDHPPALSRPLFSRDDMFRPSSRSSNRNAPTTLKKVLNTWEVPDYGPATLPSPISTPRASEDQAPPTNPAAAAAAADPWDDDLDLFTAPVIQTVRARRDTLTSIASRRRSLEIKVEEPEKPAVVVADAPQRPKTSHGGQQLPRRPMRPPPLNLVRTPDRAGTYPPVHQPPSTPTDERMRRPPRDRDRAGPPPAAVGARGRPGRGVHRPNVDEYDFQPRSQSQSQSQSQTRRVSQDSSTYERPLSPDSPLMPVTGPLASPRFATLESQLAPPPRGGARFRAHRDPSPLRESESESSVSVSVSDGELAAPRLGGRNVPTPDSSQWPLPSPTASSFGAASPSCADSSSFAVTSGTRYYDEPEPESPLPTPPRVIPVPPRADSPFGFRSFNFSRPMTPTSDLPLRRDPPRRADTVPVPVSPMHRDRDRDVSPSSGCAPPPPRAATVNHGTVGRGLRSPAIVGDDFGVGFI
ncbi:hypothetical protein F4818DRAFT_242639 [Hypoxylon cercidicola]|nr:hypothetical protein F4818DRAFT_242639 [Hypoxylon cercidicola]